MTVSLEALGHRVKRTQYRHHRALDDRLSAIGTTLTQWDALRAIARTPGASAHALAVATFQSDQSFGTLANRLAAQNLIERRAGQGRRIEHRLTDEGERMLERAQPLAEEVVELSFAKLSPAECDTLYELLGRVAGDDLEDQASRASSPARTAGHSGASTEK